MTEFQAWPKIPRLFRRMIITEKIDGTNAAVIVNDDFTVAAQSRTRLITPADDNYGFARWVETNAETLANLLGPGRHFGEWWGQGIQRRYGMTEKRFSLFNISRYADVDFAELPQVGLVPELYVGPFDTDQIRDVLNDLDEMGSQAAPGFMDPEGIVVFHAASNEVFKVTIERDEEPKGRAA